MRFSSRTPWCQCHCSHPCLWCDPLASSLIQWMSWLRKLQWQCIYRPYFAMVKNLPQGDIPVVMSNNMSTESQICFNETYDRTRQVPMNPCRKYSSLSRITCYAASSVRASASSVTDLTNAYELHRKKCWGWDPSFIPSARWRMALMSEALLQVLSQFLCNKMLLR